MNTKSTPTTLTAYKLNKQLSSSIDIYDLLEAYYPEKHNTIVRMRNIAYRELVETGAIKADGTIDGEVAVPYRKLLNTYIPLTGFLALQILSLTLWRNCEKKSI